MKNIYLLGATGSIGKQTIDIIKAYPNEFDLKAISGFNNFEQIIELAKEFNLDMICVKDQIYFERLKQIFPSKNIVFGNQGLSEIAKLNPEDKTGVLINALVGMVGLRPTVDAIKLNRNVLLANKETLVVGGHIIKELLNKYQSKLYPIDSEHSAIWQVLNGEDRNKIKKLIITASGGSFRDFTREQLKNVTVEAALNHPNWQMGNKITIDSATMMNKGFEVIEAAYLFDIDIENIEIIIHRESIIHSMVEFVDSSIIAQMSNHDMKLPIAYAMFYPNRTNNLTKSLDLIQCNHLSFEPLDLKRYPCLNFAIKAYKIGGSMRTVLNASNEAAVDLFLRKKVSFLQIEEIIENELNSHKQIDFPDLDTIYNIDKQVKQRIYSLYEK
jgi:1-deoxy-D-xylulose-5-phosphate reductoisomerase